MPVWFIIPMALLLESGKIIGDAPSDSYTAVNYPSAIMEAAPQ